MSAPANSMTWGVFLLLFLGGYKFIPRNSSRLNPFEEKDCVFQLSKLRTSKYHQHAGTLDHLDDHPSLQITRLVAQVIWPAKWTIKIRLIFKIPYSSIWLYAMMSQYHIHDLIKVHAEPSGTCTNKNNHEDEDSQFELSRYFQPMQETHHSSVSQLRFDGLPFPKNTSKVMIWNMFFPTCQVRVVRFYVSLFSSFSSSSILSSFVVLLN